MSLNHTHYTHQDAKMNFFTPEQISGRLERLKQELNNKENFEPNFNINNSKNILKNKKITTKNENSNPTLSLIVNVCPSEFYSPPKSSRGPLTSFQAGHTPC